MKTLITKLAAKLGNVPAEKPDTTFSHTEFDPGNEHTRDQALSELQRAGYRVLRDKLPGGRQYAIVLPPDMAPVDPAENDALWSAFSRSLERLTVTARSTQRLPFVSGAGAEGKGKVRQ